MQREVFLPAFFALLVVGLGVRWALPPAPRAQAPAVSAPQPGAPEPPRLVVGTLGKVGELETTRQHLAKVVPGLQEVAVEGGVTLTYGEAAGHLSRHEWDVVFALSPMVSVAAKRAGYTFAARMFPKGPPYYRSALFVAAASPIKSLADVGPHSTVALGDRSSASSFYMPLYDLYGKTLTLTTGKRSSEIKELVASGKAEVGAAAEDVAKKDPRFRIIHLSRDIPGSNVYLSPTLSEARRAALARALAALPAEIAAKANVGPGKEPDYAQFSLIADKVEQLLGCADLTQRPASLYCTTPTAKAQRALGQVLKGVKAKL